jgi:cyclase
LAVDVKRTGSSWNVFSHGGSRSLDINAIEWIKEAEDRGIGEILLTSMDADGTQAGVDLEITRMISDMVSIPVIASGGIGTLNHFKDAFNIGKADAVLAASVFHRDIIPIKKVIKYLAENGIQVR